VWRALGVGQAGWRGGFGGCFGGESGYVSCMLDSYGGLKWFEIVWGGGVDNLAGCEVRDLLFSMKI